MRIRASMKRSWSSTPVATARIARGIETRWRRSSVALRTVSIGAVVAMA
jgi:hypothetical protein